MFSRKTLECTCLLVLVLPPALPGAPKKVSFSQPAASVAAYDFVEVTANVEGPDAHNPFTDATLRGSFGKASGSGSTAVDGFCDSADGGVFRIRFMPPSPGDYKYSVAYRQ